MANFFSCPCPQLLPTNLQN
uniref:Uncharacterized protein n=1 Tax=Arundo donax TaxID=35708 RepID=A0A0A9HFI3_ARUDO